jgi:hypothetical protein
MWARIAVPKNLYIRVVKLEGLNAEAEVNRMRSRSTFRGWYKNTHGKKKSYE